MRLRPSGSASVMPAPSTPGISLTLRSTSSKYAFRCSASCTGYLDRRESSRPAPARSPCRHRARESRLRISRPAPTRSTQANAISDNDERVPHPARAALRGSARRVLQRVVQRRATSPEAPAQGRRRCRSGSRSASVKPSAVAVGADVAQQWNADGIELRPAHAYRRSPGRTPTTRRSTRARCLRSASAR